MWHAGQRWYGISHYVFLDRIHQGVTAEVWRAYSLKDHQLYAVKVLCTSLLKRKPAVIFAPDSDDNEMITEWDRCMKELRILNQLAEYPNVVNVIETINCPDPNHPWQAKSESYNDESPAFIIMEWLPERLAEFVQEKQYDRTVSSVDDFWNIAEQLLIIAQILRKEGICHKDIKPENLLMYKSVTRDFSSAEQQTFVKTRDMAGHPFLLLEKTKQECPQNLADSIVVNIAEQLASRPQRIVCIDFNVSSERLAICDSEGTNAFTPPETLLKINPTFDGPKRDIWSIGVTLLVLLTKELPFYNPIPIYLQFQILQEEVKWDVQKIRGPEFQPCLHLCRMLLRKDPEERWGDEQALEYISEHKLSDKTLEQLSFLF